MCKPQHLRSKATESLPNPAHARRPGLLLPSPPLPGEGGVETMTALNSLAKLETKTEQVAFEDGNEEEEVSAMRNKIDLHQWDIRV